MDFKIFKICIKLNKKLTYEGVQAFSGILHKKV
ncbi:hypothetical protein J2S18_002000 [Eubacterium multiforme]|uniref:Uncharacterized protein n=1 Tax=Eubacterium multiforme TaxID=83339 RepID=A0ABT9UUR0_9FIRM|nr:hypothetical protein [Eubacterium multiforme]